MKNKEQKTCMYCGQPTDNKPCYWPMAPIDPEMEKVIDVLGRDKWWEKVDWDNATEEQEKLSFYDQLINTVGRGIVCDDCIKKEDEAYLKYYPPTEEIPKNPIS